MMIEIFIILSILAVILGLGNLYLHKLEYKKWENLLKWMEKQEEINSAINENILEKTKMLKLLSKYIK